MDNWQLIIDPKKTGTRKELIEFIDSDINLY